MLAAETGKDNSQISTAARELVDRGCLETEPNPDHVNSRLYKIASGQFEFVQDLVQSYETSIGRAYQQLERAEKDWLLETGRNIEIDERGNVRSDTQYLPLREEDMPWVFEQVLDPKQWPRGWNNRFQAYSASSIAAYLNRTNGGFYPGFLAVQGSHHVGFALATYDDAERIHCTLRLVMVLQLYREKGIGRGLIRHIKEFAGQNDAADLAVTIRIQDVGLQKIIKSEGFNKRSNAETKRVFGVESRWKKYQYDYAP